MTDVASDTPLSAEAIDRIREDVRSIISGERVTNKSVADEANIAPGTFNAWLAGSYAGDNVRVAREAEKWLEARRQRKSIKAIVPIAPSFIKTKSADKIVDVFSYAQTLHDMGLVIGSPGTGKTTAINYYRAANPNVFVITMEPAKSTVHHLLIELATALGLAVKAPLQIATDIVKKLRDRDALVIADEAQHLNTQAIDQMRSIHDKAGCGVVLVGNESVITKLGDPDRTPQLAQLYSRFGLRLNLQRPGASDIDALLKAWEVDDKDEKAFMRLVASKPGGLRSVTKVMVAAGAMAKGNGEERTIAHMRDAWTRVGAGPIGNS